MKKKNDDPHAFHNLIILDESGSMSNIEKQALSGVNETIATIRNAQVKFPNLKQMLTLVTFDSNGDGHDVRTIFEDLPINEVRDIDANDYRPNGCTPLYDAMGISLAKLKTKVKGDEHALVTIITDGLENASHEYSGKAIKNIVGLLRERGWIFNYVGANQDAVEVATDLNIDRAINFVATPTGAEDMFHQVCEDTMNCIVAEAEQKYGRKP